VSANTQTVTAGAPTEAPPRRKPQLSEGARAERRLGFTLVAPAVIVMLAVAAYPIIYAVYLSLQRYNLALPQDQKFVGFSNYAAVLSSSYWWQALEVTLIITVFSVAITLVLGMALAFVLHRTIFGRGTIRTTSLIPYGIVTVAAAYSWQYAWTPGQGYLSSIFNNSAPLTNHVQALIVIIIAEIWKTTPFMALLLLAGMSLVPDDLLKAARGGRRHGLAALHEDHAAADEAGDPGRPAVPDAGLVPDFRQHLHPHRGRQRHRIGLDPRLRQPVQRAEPGHRLGDLDSHLHLRRDHRHRFHQRLRDRGPGHGFGKQVTRRWLP